MFSENPSSTEQTNAPGTSTSNPIGNLPGTPRTPSPEAIPRAPLPRNEEELLAQFTAALQSDESSIYSRVHDPLLPRTPPYGDIRLYPLFSLESLIETTDLEDNYKIIRYVVTADNQLIFARNGTASFSVPFHTEMATHCLTAGDIFINENNQIAAINNSSGHFRPDWPSMVFLLRILLNHGDFLANDLEFRFHGDSRLRITIPVDALLLHPSRFRNGDYIQESTTIQTITREGPEQYRTTGGSPLHHGLLSHQSGSDYSLGVLPLYHFYHSRSPNSTTPIGGGLGTLPLYYSTTSLPASAASAISAVAAISTTPASRDISPSPRFS